MNNLLVIAVGVLGIVLIFWLLLGVKDITENALALASFFC